MGGCVSTSSHRTRSSRNNGETMSHSCLGIGFCGQKRTKTFSDRVFTLQSLPSIPNRIFTNGKSRTSCIFTQQGRKGINQDAMVVWEVSLFFTLGIIFECVGRILFLNSVFLNFSRTTCQKMRYFVVCLMATVHMVILLLAK